MRAIILAASAALLATTAFAQIAPPPPPGGPPVVWQQTTTITGMVSRFTLTPRGDLDGLILADGTQVHVPPHLSAELAAAVKAGDAVTANGYRSPSGALFIATSVTDTANSRTVVDRGPPAPGMAPPPPPPGMPAPGAQNMTAQGRVQRLLRGPADDVNGAILEDGTLLHVPPHLAFQGASLFTPGQSIVAQGFGLDTPYGRVVEAQTMGASTAQVGPIIPLPGAPLPRR